MLRAVGSAISPGITQASGTGITPITNGFIGRSIYKVTVTFAALAAAALTADAVVGAIPAKTRLVGIVLDCTTVFSGGTIATATMSIGKTVGGVEWMAAVNVFAAPATFGNADVDLGTAMVRAAAVQGGDLPSWSAATNVNVRLTTTVGNTNAATQGSATIYLVCEVYP